MSDVGECIHGLGPVASCVICNGRQQREADEARRIAYRFPAKWDGHCDWCHARIGAGEEMARTAGDELVCEECAS